MIVELPNGIVLHNVHEVARCVGHSCVIHRPTVHHMNSLPLIWRDDRAIFERICPHNIGHPDPDQYAYWEATDRMWQSVHGCDGCCRKETS